MLSSSVDRLAAADAGRLGELYVRHADDAVRLAYLLTGDPALAEDLVQDAFVRLAGRLAHLRDPGAFHAYLRKTVVNLSNSHFRRRKVERAYLERARGAVSVQGTEWSDRSVEGGRTCGGPWGGSPSASAPPSSCGSTRTSPSDRSPRSCGAVRGP